MDWSHVRALLIETGFTKRKASMRVFAFIAFFLVWFEARATESELKDLQLCLQETRASVESTLRFVPRVVIRAERTLMANLEHLSILERTTEELALKQADPTHDPRLRFAAGNGYVACEEFARGLKTQMRQLLLTLGSAALSALVAFLHLCFSIFNQPTARKTADSWMGNGTGVPKQEPRDRARGQAE